ncbi:hypothetical protein B0T10DRAFT_466302 [Thelonectria olida]|uniref:Uncharacterized protein n=1 Tax=Thelonectria olida TaxID=1576542 RepID=A0A9P9AIV5_9HYPO|nr:hypothetical protein B0T10DRAFT_466302 [Thelonectria olida]
MAIPILKPPFQCPSLENIPEPVHTAGSEPLLALQRVTSVTSKKPGAAQLEVRDAGRPSREVDAQSARPDSADDDILTLNRCDHSFRSREPYYKAHHVRRERTFTVPHSSDSRQDDDARLSDLQLKSFEFSGGFAFGVDTPEGKAPTSFAFAMPPKRKRTGAHPPPPQPEAPRRSSWRLEEQPVIDEARDSSHMEIDGVKGDQHKGLLEKKMGKKEDLQKTMRELSELEHKFQSVARRHRLDVEISDLHVEPDSPSQLAFKPRAHLPRRDTDLASFQSSETKLLSQEQTEISTCKVLSQPLDISLYSDGALDGMVAILVSTWSLLSSSCEIAEAVRDFMELSLSEECMVSSSQENVDEPESSLGANQVAAVSFFEPLALTPVVRRIVGPGDIPGGSQSCRRKKFSGQNATAKVGHAACTYERQGGIEAPYIEGAEGPRGESGGPGSRAAEAVEGCRRGAIAQKVGGNKARSVEQQDATSVVWAAKAAEIGWTGTRGRGAQNVGGSRSQKVVAQLGLLGILSTRHTYSFYHIAEMTSHIAIRTAALTTSVS